MLFCRKNLQIDVAQLQKNVSPVEEMIWNEFSLDGNLFIFIKLPARQKLTLRLPHFAAIVIVVVVVTAVVVAESDSLIVIVVVVNVLTS